MSGMDTYLKLIKSPSQQALLNVLHVHITALSLLLQSNSKREMV